MVFFRYFLSFLFKSRTRQRLLFLAVVGLFLSSFSLFVLQSVMGGLQKGLISRSKNYFGSYVIELSDQSNLSSLRWLLNSEHLSYSQEFEMELLVRSGEYVSPAVIHGVSREGNWPHFLKGLNQDHSILGVDLANALKIHHGDQFQMISPAHTTAFLGEIPRLVSDTQSDTLVSELPELDRFHVWVRAELLFNLTRQISYNSIRLFDQKVSPEILAKIESLGGKVVSWEMKNQSLVWALKLENNVMVILFVSMAMLVAIAITSGFLIFFAKVRTDLVSFWILGMSKDKLMRLIFFFGQFLSLTACLSGIALAFCLLYALDHWGGNLMPDVFVERKIPVEMTWEGLAISFFVPYVISFIFITYSYRLFSKENSSFVKLVRL